MQAQPYHFIFKNTHPCFSGHFPKNPVAPGAVIIEQVMLKWKIFSNKRIIAFDYSKFTHPLLPDTECVVNFIKPTANKKNQTSSYQNNTQNNNQNNNQNNTQSNKQSPQKIEFTVQTTANIIICKGRLIYE